MVSRSQRSSSPTLKPETPRVSVGPIVVVVVWAVTAATALLALHLYASVPGPRGSAPTDWPHESALPRATNRFTLLMFLHPHCPCGSASVGELERLLTRNPGKLDATAVLMIPRRAPDGWDRSPLPARLAEFPGVRVLRDPGGTEARKFGAGTSGHVLLFDPQGKLCFSGGITAARGHEGDNPGRASIERLLEGRSSADTNWAVFGCPLDDPGAAATADSR